MRSELIQVNWRDFNSSRKWFKKLRLRNEDKEIPAKTLEAMQTWFPPFLAFCNKTPDELIEEALNDDEIVQDRLDDFYRFKKKSIDRNSCITGIHGVIRGFYRHNKINTQDIIAPKFSVRMVKKTDSNFPLFKIITKSDVKKIVLNRELLREFHSKLNTRDQCILLCLMSTGLESSDFLKLTVGDIRAQIDLPRIYMNGNRNKTFSEFSDFCSKEATIAIKNYVKKERREAVDEDPVFVITLAGQKRIFQMQNNRSWKLGDTLPTPNAISPREIADAFRTAQKNMGIALQKGKQSPLRPKRFKKVFRTACNNAGLDKDITKTFLGHKGDQSQNYQEDARELLEYYYELVEPKISLFFDEEADLDDKNEMKLEMVELKQKIDTLQKKSDSDDSINNKLIEYQNMNSITPSPQLVSLVLKILKEKHISY